MSTKIDLQPGSPAFGGGGSGPPSDPNENRNDGHDKDHNTSIDDDASSANSDDSENEGLIRWVDNLLKRAHRKGKYQYSQGGSSKKRATISKFTRGARRRDACMNCIYYAMDDTASFALDSWDPFCYDNNISSTGPCFHCNKHDETCEGKAPIIVRRVARHLINEVKCSQFERSANLSTESGKTAQASLSRLEQLRTTITTLMSIERLGREHNLHDGDEDEPSVGPSAACSESE